MKLLFLAIMFLAFLPFGQAQIQGGTTGGVASIIKDAKGTIISINVDNKAIAHTVVKKLNHLNRKVQKLLEQASASWKKCQSSDNEFTSLKEFDLYLHGMNWMESTTSIFATVPNVDQCQNEDDAISYKSIKKGTYKCFLTTEMVKSIKQLTKAKQFHNYLYLVEGMEYQEATSTIKYLNELVEAQSKP